MATLKIKISLILYWEVLGKEELEEIRPIAMIL